MASEYYTHTTFPATSSFGSSAQMRAELDLIDAGFAKLPTMTGNGGKVVVVNSGGGALAVASTLSESGSTVTASNNLTVSSTLTAGSVTAATLTVSSTVSGVGFTNYLASPPAIGGTTPNAATFSNLTVNGTVSGAGFTNYLASPPAIGGTAANAATFTNVTLTGALGAAGNVLITGAGALGYGTGSGGSVPQTGSRTNGVTLNKTNGTITLVSAAGSASWQSFTVTNSTVAATDVVRVVQASGTDLYQIHVTAVAAGSFRITFATTGGTTTEQPVFNFAVFKVVTA